jgi:hypothetical protein
MSSEIKSNSAKEQTAGKQRRTEAEAQQLFTIQAAAAASEASPELNERELLKRFRTSFTSNVLPEAPEIPGYHVCWVPMSSNNRQDTVDARLSMGYSVVKPDEVPHFMSPSNRGATVDGCVSHNELILLKIPMKIYQLYMIDAHHTQPNEEEANIKEKIQRMEDKEGASIVRDLDEMTGIKNLAKKTKVPTFS